MPVHRHKKDTTLNAPDSTQEQPAPAVPDQQAFQHYLRELARAAIRVVLEGVMREELDVLIGVGWGECSPKRKGYRNGSYTRDGSDRGDQRPKTTAKASSTPRSSTATAALNPRWRKDSPRCLWPESARTKWGKWLKR